MNYSRSPWRLVDSDGREITARMPFDHPDIGTTWITQPVCGNTKTQCTERALQMLEILLKRQQSGEIAKYGEQK